MHRGGAPGCCRVASAAPVYIDCLSAFARKPSYSVRARACMWRHGDGKAVGVCVDSKASVRVCVCARARVYRVGHGNGDCEWETLRHLYRVHVCVRVYMYVYICARVCAHGNNEDGDGSDEMLHQLTDMLGRIPLLALPSCLYTAHAHRHTCWHTSLAKSMKNETTCHTHAHTCSRACAHMYARTRTHT